VNIAVFNPMPSYHKNKNQQFVVKKVLILTPLDREMAGRAILSLSDNLIPDSAGVKRQASLGGSTVHAASTVFSLFQKQCSKIRVSVHFLLSNGVKKNCKNV
jgi:hypothetical protein